MSRFKVHTWSFCHAGLRFWRVWVAVPVALLMAVFSGCAPEVALHGLVTDTTGEALPGVSVKVKGSEVFAVTNGQGVFGKRPGRLTLSPGTCELRYIKTGFTTVEQVVNTGEGRSFEVPAVVLWPLPGARGIYDRTENRYRSWTRVEPMRYLREDRSPLFATKQAPELSLTASLGKIIAHKVSTYDWRMSRLEKVVVLREGAGGGEEPVDEVWAEALRIPLHATPVDEPERQLWEIRPARKLGPGIYAIHWGAFDGDSTTDPSAYLVEVLETPVAADEAEAGGGDDAGGEQENQRELRPQPRTAIPANAENQ